VKFPSYRTDLAKQLAEELGLRFYDFREEYMLGFGSAAADIPLAALQYQIERVADRAPVLVHNAESLLSTIGDRQRRVWLGKFLKAKFANWVLLPVYLFGELVDETMGQVVEIDAEGLPSQGLISRLAN